MTRKPQSRSWRATAVCTFTRGQAELLNASGGIEVGISEGTAAWVDAKSTKGAVRSSLPTQDNPDTFDNKVKVYARARRDDIVIHRAAV